MVELTQAIVLGVVQGITEWLPVSSSGHLVILQYFFGLKEEVTFDLVLHVATLIVVLWVFRNDLVAMVKALFKGGSVMEDPDRRLIVMLAVGSLPIAIVGLLFENVIKEAFSQVLWVGVALVFTGIVLLATRWFTKHRSDEDLSVADAGVVGLFQTLAVFPGVSRSGMTISGALFRGVEREMAARYAFLLFIPAITGAVLLNLGDVALNEVVSLAVLVGAAVAMVTSYAAIKVLLSIVKKEGFYLFGYYCVILGLLVLLFVS